MILATPAQLLHKIKAMRTRERELEIALQKAQSRICRDPHHLLVQPEQGQRKALDELPHESIGNRSVPAGEGVSVGGNKASPAGTNSIGDLSQALGTLSITAERGSKVCNSI